MSSPRARSRLAPLALLTVSLLGGCSKSEEQPAAPPVMPVTVAQPIQQQVVDWDEFVGRFEAQQNVEVRPRATGYLQSVHFREGQYVRAGQLLFTIDARPSQAALAQSQAQLARAQATITSTLR